MVRAVMAHTTAAQRWLTGRSYHHSAFPAERVRSERAVTVSVCVPARDTAGTIGPIVRTLLELREQEVIDQVVVVDASSRDGTAEIAAREGAEVHQETDLLPSFGPVRGKGDAMWRALSVLSGDVVCFVDGDSAGFGPHFACGLVGAVACEPGVRFAKAFYRRPFRVGDVTMHEGGGRVNELTARPLLNLFYPELAGVRQPLAGEIAAERELLEGLPFATGYAVEIAMLVDVYKEVGLDAIAQVDLDVRQNEHQPLSALRPMAYAVLLAVAARLQREGRLSEIAAPDLLAPVNGGLESRTIELIERPPLASLRASGERA
jgi:glucosyl-3-phosphoglycerate synthase